MDVNNLDFTPFITEKPKYTGSAADALLDSMNYNTTELLLSN